MSGCGGEVRDSRRDQSMVLYKSTVLDCYIIVVEVIPGYLLRPW